MMCWMLHNVSQLSDACRRVTQTGWTAKPLLLWKLLSRSKRIVVPQPLHHLMSRCVFIPTPVFNLKLLPFTFKVRKLIRWIY